MSQAVFLLVSLLFASASAQVPTSPTLKDNIKKCNEKYEIPEEILKGVVDHSEELPLDAPMTVRCNVKCVAELEGFITQNGSYDVEKSVSIVKEGFKLSDDKAQELRKHIEECNIVGTDYKGDEECMITFLTARCIQTKLLLIRPKPN